MRSPAGTSRHPEAFCPLHVFPWGDRAQRAGLARDALYLVRPDGYVALADASAEPARLEAYVRRHFA